MEIILPVSEGVFKCKICKDFSSKRIEIMREHLVSLPHLVRVSTGHETLTIVKQPLPVSKMLNNTVEEMASLTLDTPSAASNLIFTLLVLNATNYLKTILPVPQLDGSFKCRECENFECNGIAPMKQHLEGQKHRKNVLRNKELATAQTQNVGRITSAQTQNVGRITSAQIVESAVDITGSNNYYTHQIISTRPKLK